MKEETPLENVMNMVVQAKKESIFREDERKRDSQTLNSVIVYIVARLNYHVA
jgi:hypothetical protein